MKKLTTQDYVLALCIALFPPIWAVLAPYLSVQTGAVALICAGVYVEGGNSAKNAGRMSVGFLMGDVWAVLVVLLTAELNWNPNLRLFTLLFIGGGLAVLISSMLPKLVNTSCWLCGWAIGLTIMAPMGWEALGTTPIQIAVAMLVGVWYVGVFVDIVNRKLMKLLKK